MRLLTQKMRALGAIGVLTVAALATTNAPADASTCVAGVCVPDEFALTPGWNCSLASFCVPDPTTSLPDVFGNLAGEPCGGLFTYEGDEGTKMYYRGPITNATYMTT